MHHLRFGLAASLSLSLTACGGVAVDSPAHQDPTPGPAPSPTPTSPAAKSLICSGAPVTDGHDVALYYPTTNSVEFVHHDGSSSIAWSAPGTAPPVQAEVRSSATRIFVATHTDVGEQSTLQMFDRRGTLLAQRSFTDGFISHPFPSDDGWVAFTLGKGEDQEGFRWDGSTLTSLGPWIPVGPTANGFTPARSTWSADAAHAFISESGSVVPVYSDKAPVWRVGERLVFIEPLTQTLRIATPNGTQALALGDFGATDEHSPIIEQVRDEGYALLRRDTWAKGDVLVVHVSTAKLDFYPDTSPKPDDLSFYCNSGWPGTLTSSGSLLRSRIAGGQLQVWLTSPTAETPVGTPLTSIAALGLVERGGTVAIVGSDGSDTYCGTPSDIWQDPAPKGSLSGDSLQLVRGSAAPRLGKFPGSFNAPSIHPSGACVLSSSFKTPEWQTRVEDLDSDGVIELPDARGLARWLE